MTSNSMCVCVCGKKDSFVLSVLFYICCCYCWCYILTSFICKNWCYICVCVCVRLLYVIINEGCLWVVNITLMMTITFFFLSFFRRLLSLLFFLFRFSRSSSLSSVVYQQDYQYYINILWKKFLFVILVEIVVRKWKWKKMKIWNIFFLFLSFLKWYFFTMRKHEQKKCQPKECKNKIFMLFYHFFCFVSFFLTE